MSAPALTDLSGNVNRPFASPAAVIAPIVSMKTSLIQTEAANAVPPLMLRFAAVSAPVASK